MITNEVDDRLYNVLCLPFTERTISLYRHLCSHDQIWLRYDTGSTVTLFLKETYNCVESKTIGTPAPNCTLFDGRCNRHRYPDGGCNCTPIYMCISAL